MAFQKRILITLLLGVVLISAFFVITTAITKYTGYSVVGVDSNFKACLSQQEIILYINTAKVSETLNNLEL
jgi:hypothetical protein